MVTGQIDTCIILLFHELRTYLRTPTARDLSSYTLNKNHRQSDAQNSWFLYAVFFCIITHLASQTYVWHGCKWNFAGPQIYLQPAKIKSQHFGVSVKFLVCNWKYCI